MINNAYFYGKQMKRIGDRDKVSILENGSFYIDSKKYKQNGI